MFIFLVTSSTFVLAVTSQPPIPKIWFIETAYRQRMDGRQACAIESAARHNPSFQVHLLTTSDLVANDHYVRLVSKIRNFETTLVNLSTVFRSTPLESWNGTVGFKTAKYPVEDLSDFLRYVILWQHGGVYLDLDVITLKSLRGLKNCAVHQEGTLPANGILFFDKGHDFLLRALKTCPGVYNPNVWGTCGPPLLKHISRDGSFQGRVTFLKADSFLAVKWQDWEWFFNPNFTGLVFAMLQNSYGAHIWNKFSKALDIGIGSGSTVDVLYRFNCPRVY
ncbi:unnamed protein product, partial [Ixodes hexagonus]